MGWIEASSGLPDAHLSRASDPCWSRDETEVGVSEWQAGVGLVNKYYLLFPAWMSSRKKGRKELDVDD